MGPGEPLTKLFPGHPALPAGSRLGVNGAQRGEHAGPGHDGHISFGSLEAPVHRVLPNQPASRVHGLRHLWICLQEFGDTRTMVEM